MDNNKTPYLPIVPLAIARRIQIPEGKYYEPLTVVGDTRLMPQGVGPYHLFDGNRKPCNSWDEAIYVEYFAFLPVPPGFQVCNPGYSPDGRPIPTIENYSNKEKTVIWQVSANATNTWMSSRPIPAEPTAPTVTTPKVAFVKRDGTVITSPNSSTGAQSGITELQETPEETQYQLSEGNDGYYLKAPKKVVPSRVTNFVIHLTEIHHHIGLNHSGEEDYREIHLEVRLFEPDKTVTLTIPYEQVNQILDIVKRKVGDANVFNHYRIFVERLEVLLRSNLRYCSDIFVYRDCGWTKLPNNQRFYVHDGAVPPIDNVRFNCGFSFGHGPYTRNVRDIVLAAYEILGVAKDRPKIIIPFLWAHMGLMFSLFAEMGFPPRTLLFVNGISGSLKTAVSKLLFNFTAIPQHDIPATFRDTSASMEISIAQYKDRVLLVDDYCPAANRAARSVIEQTLERLIRFYGDGNTTGRADPRMDKVHAKKANGVCIITGEDTAGSLSSLLRCLFLPVGKGSYNGQALQTFQDSPYLWTEYLELFVKSLFVVIPNLMERSKAAFPILRNMAEQHIKERRIVDICAILMLVAQITLEVSSKLSGVDLLTQYKGEFEQAILRTCVESEEHAIRQNPAKIFASTLLTLIQRGDATLGTAEEFIDAPKEYIGVDKDGYWWLWPVDTYLRVSRYYEADGRNFPLTQPALWERLAAEGVLIPTTTNRKGTPSTEYGTKVSFGNRPRLLKINPRRLFELTEPE